MAAVVMRNSDFRSVVEPILNKTFDGIYDQRADEYKRVFKDENGTPRNYHEEPVLVGFGAAPVMLDGVPVTYDQGSTLYIMRATYNVYGLAFAITKVLAEDGDHIRIGKTFSEHLARSLVETRELDAANILNRAFNGSYTGGDGVSLCNSSHPVKSGNAAQSNLTTAAALSQTSLEDMLISIRQASDSSGRRIKLRPQSLIVPPALVYQAQVLLKSVLRTGTANNDINPLKGELSEMEPQVLTRLTSNTAWFVKVSDQDVPRGLLMLWRRKLEKSMEGDFETDSMRYKATERRIATWVDWRAIYGNQGA